MNLPTRSRMSSTRFSIILLGLAIAIRFGAALALRDKNMPPDQRTTGADGVEYNLLAERLARGDGYTWVDGRPTAFRAPGFPLILSAVHWFEPRTYCPFYLLFAGLGGVTCVLTYRIAQELFDENTARVCAGLALVYFPHVYFSTRFDSENLFATLLAIAVYSLLRFDNSDRFAWILIAGVTLGLAILTRPFALLLLPLWCGYLIVRLSKFPRRSIALNIGFVLSSLLVVMPWTLRNVRELGAPVLVATNGGSTFYGGNNDVVARLGRAWGGWVATNQLPGSELIEAVPNEVAHDAMEWMFGRKWIGSHLLEVPVLLAAKVGRFWLPEFDSANRGFVFVSVLTTLPVVTLAFFGFVVSLIKLRQLSSPWWIIHLSFAATLITMLVFWGSSRFRDANVCILLPFATLVVKRLQDSWSFRRRFRKMDGAVERPTFSSSRRVDSRELIHAR